MADTTASLTEAVLTRLNDLTEQVWSAAQVERYLLTAYATLTRQARVFWDWTYAENLPASFSYTAPWESVNGYVDYDAGVANFTSEFERHLLTESSRIGPAVCTSVFEAAHFSDEAMPATSELPARVTELDRVVWDRATIAALDPATVSRLDSRYELTEGEVYGFTFRKDGIRTLRKIRKPSAKGAQWTHTGAWGIARDVTDLSTGQTGAVTHPIRFSYTQAWELSQGYAQNGTGQIGAATFTASWEDGLLASDHGPANHQSRDEYNLMVRAGLTPTTVSAYWGPPRQVPGEHPIGYWSFGLPRRFYHDGTNVRVEHWRQGRDLADRTHGSELPTRYTAALKEYALWRCLQQQGPGQDLTLANYHQQRWQRQLARIARRIEAVGKARASRMGAGSSVRRGPPRPSLPWAYGSVVRR